MAEDNFKYAGLFELPPPAVKFRLVAAEGVSTVKAGGRDTLEVSPEALTRLAGEAFRDVSFLLHRSHNEQVAAILRDPGASENDRFMARCLLENAAISAGFELPLCQDTGTAVVLAHKGELVRTGCDDVEALSRGARQAYTSLNLRYSQVLPLNMYEERNSGDNMPAQVDIYAAPGVSYDFLFMANGGGSANRTALFQASKALLAPENLGLFLIEKMLALGTSACPPYRVAFVIGGPSAEACLKAVKLASAGVLDALPDSPGAAGRPFRDRALEAELLEAARERGPGAQFGGRHFAHSVRVIRLPRHAASLPIGLGAACSADRHILGKIDAGGLWLEELDRDPASLIPAGAPEALSAGGAIKVNLNRPMAELRMELSKYPLGSRLSLSGRLVVARDAAHLKFRELLEAGRGLPAYLSEHPVYYAGPAKTPAGRPSGSFGPTTAGRMDDYTALLQARGASLVMIAKGGRSAEAAEACRKYGGFYLGSPGGPAALLAERCIKKVETLDYPELGMEAVQAVDVANFPAFLLIDDKGGDFFRSFR